MSDDRASDVRGSRRLRGREEWFWYVAAGVSYTGLAIFHKWLLDWVIGPLWLVGFVCLGPAIVDRIRPARAGAVRSEKHPVGEAGP